MYSEFLLRIDHGAAPIFMGRDSRTSSHRRHESDLVRSCPRCGDRGRDRYRNYKRVRNTGRRETPRRSRLLRPARHHTRRAGAPRDGARPRPASLAGRWHTRPQREGATDHSGATTRYAYIEKIFFLLLIHERNHIGASDRARAREGCGTDGTDGVVFFVRLAYRETKNFFFYICKNAPRPVQGIDT